MRITFHIKKFTVTLIVVETSRKARARKKDNRHSGK